MIAADTLPRAIDRQHFSTHGDGSENGGLTNTVRVQALDSASPSSSLKYRTDAGTLALESEQGSSQMLPPSACLTKSTIGCSLVLGVRQLSGSLGGAADLRDFFSFFTASSAQLSPIDG